MRTSPSGAYPRIPSSTPFFDVIFSPQAIEQSHTARIATILGELNRSIDEDEGGDGSAHSLDIAMYSFSDAGIKTALREAVLRGVSVRMIFEPVNRAAVCKYMKMITPAKLLRSLRDGTDVVDVPPDIADRARLSVERMIAIGDPSPVGE